VGNGSGGFSAAANFTVADQPKSIALGDLNGDSKQSIYESSSFDSTVWSTNSDE
jgi:hypothetical protein